MTIIDQIKKMRENGMTEMDIIKKLQEAGYSPLEINQAIEQSKIKAAISDLNSDLPQEDNFDTELIKNMQQSIMEQSNENNLPLLPQPDQQLQISENIPEEQYEQQYPIESIQQQEYYPPQNYYQEQYPIYQPSYNENVNEIIDQIVEEKINKTRKKVIELNSFKILVEKKIRNIDVRLRKIENFIQELEIKILGKVSSYGENLQDIKKEMEMMQDSFSSVLESIKNSLGKEKKKK
ncbi:MAG: hypothetical protein QW117_01100 [Candidatus Pacearchaeota archaeon]